MMFLLFLSGVGVVSYPFISDWFFQRNRVLELVDYTKAVDGMDESLLQEEWKKAEEYNANKSNWQNARDNYTQNGDDATPAEYLSVLNVNGIMGSIEIPAIHVYLPILHGTSEETLAQGIGHLFYSDLPIGGPGNRAVLTGHTGLPTALLFTDLNKLVQGDLFYLHILDKVLAYKVTQIQVIEPQEISALRPVENQDLVTLVTCTPYGINSHRLLVTGTRTEVPTTSTEDAASPHPPAQDYSLYHILLAVGIFLLLIIFLMIWRRKKRKTRNKTGQKESS